MNSHTTIFLWWNNKGLIKLNKNKKLKKTITHLKINKIYMKLKDNQIPIKIEQVIQRKVHREAKHQMIKYHHLFLIMYFLKLYWRGK